MTEPITADIKACPDCGAKPGEFHDPGCDVERCPKCGGQAISCTCIYRFCGMDPDELETEHPEIYEHGPTKEMCAKWDAHYGQRRIPWSGEWPGVLECREFGWYSKMVHGRGWVPCPKDEPGAHENLNRLYTHAVWSEERQRFVLPGSA